LWCGAPQKYPPFTCLDSKDTLFPKPFIANRQMASAALFAKLLVESEQRMSQKYHVEIFLKECLDERWTEWFAGFALTETPDGTTRLSGDVPDPSALYGTIEYIRNLNLRLVSLQVTDLSGHFNE
jgi:hypothetical protein